MATRPFQVLTICHGNICRSPAAQYLLREALDERYAVSSAGTAAVVGWPVHETIAALLAERGIDTSGFQARQVTNALLDEAELVLTMTLRQRSWIAEDDPAVVNRAFTMKEFARLAARAPADDAKSARALVQWAGANRAVHPAASDATDDILDPYGHETGAYTTAFNEILAACGAIGAELSKRDKLRGKAPANPFADFTL